MSNLEKSFESAELVLEELDHNPVLRNNDHTFFMDVQRKFKGPMRGEYFRIFKGHPDNLVQVLNVDKKIKQLVLLVKEPPREFAINQFVSARDAARFKAQGEPHGRTWVEQLKISGLPRVNAVRIGKVEKTFIKHSGNGYNVEVFQKAPADTRWYLCGVDERQLFIAQLPKHCTTVKQAHDELKGGRVETAEGRAGGNTLRQGEYFLLNLTPDQDEMLRTALKAKRVFIQKDVNIGVITGFRRGGKPHIAEEAVVLPARLEVHGYPVNRERDVYVRGRIHHPDHRTIKLGAWRRVLKNNEPNMEGSQRGANGVYWID